MLTAGYPLSDVTAALCDRWKPGIRLLPMSDERVETHVVVADGEGCRAVHFQEWWLRMRAATPATEIISVGVENAQPAPGVLDALTDTDVVLLPPSNPVVSIGSILAVPGVHTALTQTPAPVVGVSPIIGGAPVRGMADACLAAIGVATTAGAVGVHYGARSHGTGDATDDSLAVRRGILDGWLVDTADTGTEVPGVTVRARPLLMTDVPATVEIVRAALDLAGV
jgi:LPPG:FO 2-phospho-L-lactate transferase